MGVLIEFDGVFMGFGRDLIKFESNLKVFKDKIWVK